MVSLQEWTGPCPVGPAEGDDKGGCAARCSDGVKGDDLPLRLQSV